MNDPHTEIKIIQLDSLLNIMDREFYEFEATLNSGTIPQRIDDFRALVVSMKAITSDILGTDKAKTE